MRAKVQAADLLDGPMSDRIANSYRLRKEDFMRNPGLIDAVNKNLSDSNGDLVEISVEALGYYAQDPGAVESILNVLRNRSGRDLRISALGALSALYRVVLSQDVQAAASIIEAVRRINLSEDEKEKFIYYFRI